MRLSKRNKNEPPTNKHTPKFWQWAKHFSCWEGKTPRVPPEKKSTTSLFIFVGAKSRKIPRRFAHRVFPTRHTETHKANIERAKGSHTWGLCLIQCVYVHLNIRGPQSQNLRISKVVLFAKLHYRSSPEMFVSKWRMYLLLDFIIIFSIRINELQI